MQYIVSFCRNVCDIAFAFPFFSTTFAQRKLIHRMNADSRWFRTQWMFNIDPIRISALLWCCEPSFNFSFRLLAISLWYTLLSSSLYMFIVCAGRRVFFPHLTRIHLIAWLKHLLCFYSLDTIFVRRTIFVCCNSTLKSI